MIATNHIGAAAGLMPVALPTGCHYLRYPTYTANKGAIMLTDQNDCHSRFRGVGRLYIEDGRLYYGMGGDTRMLETTKEAILECLRNRPQGENDQTFAERVVAIIQVKNLPAGKIRIHSEGVEDND